LWWTFALNVLSVKTYGADTPKGFPMTDQSIAQTFTTRTCKCSPRRLYHVTPVHNLISIHERGVDPEFSKSHPERIYFVEYRCLHWAIPFIAKKHGCSVEELIVFKAHGSKGCKSLGAGKWYASRPKSAQFFDVATNHVK
jgi:hypothetical protein